MNQTLQIILNTLNQIEVKGKANLDRLLGAVIALERLMAENAEPKEEEKHD